jgi:hypothetical protein
MEIFVKEEYRYQYINKICFSLICIIFGAFINSSISKYSIKSNLSNSKYLIKSNINNEIRISYLNKNLNEHISKFRCSGSENDIDTWVDRLCVFSNLCYNRDVGHFYYFQSKLKPLFYDSSKGMIFQFKTNGYGNPFVSLSSRGGKPWSPIVINETYPTKNLIRLHQLHSLMNIDLGAGSIAHGIWEDIGSVYYSMERMNIIDENLIVMHFDKIPNTDLFGSYSEYVIPALTKKPVVQYKNYIESFNTTYVCFDNLILGGQLSVFPKALIKENHGRESLFYNWRSKIIQYNGFDPKFVPKTHHIIITNKSQSGWTHPGSKIHRAIVNLEEVEKFIRLNYPNISTEVVEWHKIPFNKQISKLLNTTILITPCGGVSLIIPMLPHGAHAIVMDYYVTISAHGFQSGQSGSMEGAFLNHIHHVRKQYYQIYGKQDYQFDFPGAHDTREQSSIIVNMTRLQLLIDKALQEMES